LSALKTLCESYRLHCVLLYQKDNKLPEDQNGFFGMVFDKNHFTCGIFHKPHKYHLGGGYL